MVTSIITKHDLKVSTNNHSQWQQVNEVCLFKCFFFLGRINVAQYVQAQMSDISGRSALTVIAFQYNQYLVCQLYFLLTLVYYLIKKFYLMCLLQCCVHRRCLTRLAGYTPMESVPCFIKRVSCSGVTIKWRGFGRRSVAIAVHFSTRLIYFLIQIYIELFVPNGLFFGFGWGRL